VSIADGTIALLRSAAEAESTTVVSAASESIGIVSSLFVAGSVPQQWRLA
jgi:hypothetical protein